jgi:hypothetical protein
MCGVYSNCYIIYSCLCLLYAGFGYYLFQNLPFGKVFQPKAHPVAVITVPGADRPASLVLEVMAEVPIGLLVVHPVILTEQELAPVAMAQVLDDKVMLPVGSTHEEPFHDCVVLTERFLEDDTGVGPC